MDANLGGIFSASDVGLLFDYTAKGGGAGLDAKSVGDLFAQKVKENIDAVTKMGSQTKSSDESQDAITFFRNNSDKTQAGIKNSDTSAANKETKKETKMPEKAVTTEKTLTKETLEVIDKEGAKLLEDIAQTLGVEIEDVIAAMQTLGLSMADLFLQEGLTALVAQLAGGGDMMSLITNDELYGDLKELLGKMELINLDLSETLSLEDGELEVLLKTLAGQDGLATDYKAMAAKVADALSGKADSADADSLKPAQEEGPVIEMGLKADLKEEVKGKDTAEPIRQETAVPDKNQGIADKGAERHKSADSDNKGGDRAAQGMINPTSGNVSPNGALQTADSLLSSFGTKTEQIMRQVLDYMKLSVGAQTTDLEMQLHPAGLGNLRLQMAVTDGAVNAKFIAQNEAVKAALEASILTLRENLDKQGVKVSAIEVEVSSAAYDENAHNDGANAQNEFERQASQSFKRRRELNLSMLEENGLEDLSEQDLLEARMLEQTGGQVSYRA